MMSYKIKKYILTALTPLLVFGCKNPSGKDNIMISGRSFRNVKLYSKTDTLIGGANIYGDTLFFAVKNYKESYDVFPFLILNDTHSVVISPMDFAKAVDCSNNYSINVNQIDIKNGDTIFYFTHRCFNSIIYNSSLDTNSKTNNSNLAQLKEILTKGPIRKFVYSTKKGFLKFEGYKVHNTNSFCFPYE